MSGIEEAVEIQVGLQRAWRFARAAETNMTGAEGEDADQARKQVKLAVGNLEHAQAWWRKHEAAK